MSGFFRLFTKRKPRNGAPSAVSLQGGCAPPSKNEIQCTVIGLDGDIMYINVPRDSVGQVLFENVALRIDLMEVDYFGLQFTGPNNVQSWLDTTKKIRKQLPARTSFTFDLRVKFYPSEPSSLREELTRYLLVLQLKRDLLIGQLPCPFETAVELAALSLQAELGDYDPQVHTAAFVSEFRFLPETLQTEQFELAVLSKYTQMHGVTAAAADSVFLQRAKQLEQYGVITHRVLGKDGKWYLLGLTPAGIQVYDCANADKIGLFVWNCISKVAFSKNRLAIDLLDSSGGLLKKISFVFSLPSALESKCLWKCVVEQHAFFRLAVSTQSTATPTRRLLRTRSGFRYAGRTEFQTALQPARRSVHFERKPTQRSSQRSSFSRVGELEDSKEREREAKKQATMQLLERTSGDRSSRIPVKSTPVESAAPCVDTDGCCKLEEPPRLQVLSPTSLLATPSRIPQVRNVAPPCSFPKTTTCVVVNSNRPSGIPTSRTPTAVRTPELQTTPTTHEHNSKAAGMPKEMLNSKLSASVSDGVHLMSRSMHTIEQCHSQRELTLSSQSKDSNSNGPPLPLPPKLRHSRIVPPSVHCSPVQKAISTPQSPTASNVHNAKLVIAAYDARVDLNANHSIASLNGLVPQNSSSVLDKTRAKVLVTSV